MSVLLLRNVRVQWKMHILYVCRDRWMNFAVSKDEDKVDILETQRSRSRWNRLNESEARLDYTASILFQLLSEM